MFASLDYIIWQRSIRIQLERHLRRLELALWKCAKGTRSVRHDWRRLQFKPSKFDIFYFPRSFHTYTHKNRKCSNRVQLVLYVCESAHLEESIQEMHDILDLILSFSHAFSLTLAFLLYIYIFTSFSFFTAKLRL